MRVEDEFSELARLSPSRRWRFAGEARMAQRRLHGFRLASATVVEFAIGLLVVPGLVLVLAVLIDAAGAAVISWALVPFLWMAGAIGVLVRGQRRRLRLAIRRRLTHPQCLQCGFSLAGLPVKEDLVICPECGTEQMVVGDSRGLHAGTPCPECGPKPA